MTVSTRPLRWWDLPAVLAIERDLFAPDDWSVETFWSELAQGELRHYEVLEAQGRLLGYAGLAVAGRPPSVEAYVQTMAVTASARGQGHGATLLRCLLEAAVRRGATAVLLEVRTDNAVAQGLYARAGFLPQGVRRGYYQPSGADALVMLLDDPVAGLAALAPPPAPRRDPL